MNCSVIINVTNDFAVFIISQTLAYIRFSQDFSGYPDNVAVIIQKT